MTTSFQLCYMNRSGLALGYELLDTTETTMEHVIFQVNLLRHEGRLPMLATHGLENTYVLILPDHAAPDWTYPHLLLPPMLKKAVREYWANLNGQSN